MKASRQSNDDCQLDSLRDLLSFGLNTEPSPSKIERVIARERIATTMKNCTPQFFIMGEIMDRALVGLPPPTFSVVVRDVSCIISIAVAAFLDNRIRASTLWSLVKLHSSGFEDWAGLTATQRRTILQALPWHNLHDPIYRWQTPRSCREDEGTNCLRTAPTRRFANFLRNANQGNWPTFKGKASASEEILRFRDSEDCVTVAEAVRQKIAKLERPSVFRTWS